MSTYLELCQKVASKSGTVSGSGQPVAVTGQTGRLNDIVIWVNDAWTDIQNAHAGAWLWMRKEFTDKETSSGTAKYTPAAWNITDFSSWVTEKRVTTLYLQSTGVSDEGEIEPIGWGDWRVRYGRGSQTNNKPSQFAISPQNEFCLGPIPDGTYVVNGEYYKTVQTLSADGDIPECPAQFHDVILHRALMYLNAFDEGSVGYVEAKSNYAKMMFDLERDQLPRITIGSEPLA